MNIRLIGDSCCEFPEDIKEKYQCIRVPLTIEVGEHTIVDDESFDQLDFLKKVAEYPKCPKSSCPSPDMFKKAYEGEADYIFVSTLSGELSGSASNIGCKFSNSGRIATNS